jgi:hypothetical protein
MTYKEFKVDEHVFLKVNDKKRFLRLGSFPKLAERYCGSFEVLEKIGSVSYILELPSSMIIDNVFNVSNPNHVVDWILI